MPLSVLNPAESLESGFALIGVHEDEAVCKNRLFLTFCLQLMNLFKGRWRTGLYTLFKYCMCSSNSNRTKHGTGQWTNKADLQGGIRYVHKQQCGRRRLAAILSFPLLKTTPLYPSTDTDSSYVCIFSHVRVWTKVARPKSGARLLGNDAGMSLAGNVRFFVSLQRIKFPFSVMLITFFLIIGLWATHWMQCQFICT